MQQQSELEHTLYTSGRGTAIYKHQKEEDFLSGELRRGLLTDIYLQNVILEEEGAKYQILPSCQNLFFFNFVQNFDDILLSFSWISIIQFVNFDSEMC